MPWRLEQKERRPPSLSSNSSPPRSSSTCSTTGRGACRRSPRCRRSTRRASRSRSRRWASTTAGSSRRAPPFPLSHPLRNARADPPPPPPVPSQAEAPPRRSSAVVQAGDRERGRRRRGHLVLLRPLGHRPRRRRAVAARGLREVQGSIPTDGATRPCPPRPPCPLPSRPHPVPAPLREISPSPPRVPSQVLGSFIRSFGVLNELAYKTETQVFETIWSRSGGRSRDRRPRPGAPRRRCDRLMRLVVQAQMSDKQKALVAAFNRAYARGPPRVVRRDGEHRLRRPVVRASRSRGRRAARPSWSTTAPPSSARSPHTAADALRLLAEIYRRARVLWPLRLPKPPPSDSENEEHAPAAAAAAAASSSAAGSSAPSPSASASAAFADGGGSVTVRIDQIKELSSATSRPCMPTATRGCWRSGTSWRRWSSATRSTLWPSSSRAASPRRCSSSGGARGWPPATRRRGPTRASAADRGRARTARRARGRARRAGGRRPTRRTRTRRSRSRRSPRGVGVAARAGERARGCARRPAQLRGGVGGGTFASTRLARMCERDGSLPIQ